MLEQHTDPSLHKHMYHVDINPNHFSEQDISTGKAIVSNFGDLPFEDNEVDICCSSLSFNETAWSRTHKEHERLSGSTGNFGPCGAVQNDGKKLAIKAHAKDHICHNKNGPIQNNRAE